jgi:hypothetical protein
MAAIDCSALIAMRAADAKLKPLACSLRPIPALLHEMQTWHVRKTSDRVDPALGRDRRERFCDGPVE